MNSVGDEIASKRRKINSFPKLDEFLDSDSVDLDRIAIKFSRRQDKLTTSSLSLEAERKDNHLLPLKYKTWLENLVTSSNASESDWDSEEELFVKIESADLNCASLENERCPECQSKVNAFKWKESDLPAWDAKSYGSLMEESMRIKCVLEAHSITSGFVGVGVQVGVDLPSVLIGIMKAGCGFFPLEYKRGFKDSSSARRILEMRWIIVDEGYYLSSNLQSYVKHIHPIQKLGVSGAGAIYLVRLDGEGFKGTAFPSFKYAYGIRTSGTSGNRRVVLVPHTAIVTNVLDFIINFRITENDRILAIAPPTFDPSIIDLFTAIGTGARIIYVADSVKLVPAQLAEGIVKERITILQCTPSFLGRIDTSILKNVLGPCSSLRILALGGEKCVRKEFLRNVIPENSRVKVFNVYGVTEVSCWAALERINLDNDEEIGLGRPLSLVRLDVLRKENENEGEMLIGFKRGRGCVVISEKYGTVIKPFKLDCKSNFRYFQTGDLVRASVKEETKFCYINRLDRIRKRNGIKIDLEALERIAMETKIFEGAWCVDWDKSVVLVLKIGPSSHDLNNVSTELHSHLKSRLYFDHFPNKIIYLKEDPPLTSNGKLDLQKVLLEQSSCKSHSRSLCTKSFKITYDQFQQIFSSLWNFGTRKAKYSAVSDSDLFLSSGGTSMSATIFVEEFFNRIQQFGSQLHVDHEKELLCELLSKPFREVQESFFKVVETFVNYDCDFASVQICLHDKNEMPQEKGQNLIARKEADEGTPNKCELRIPPRGSIISVPIGLCVDATPVITKHPTEGQICIIGSHSGSLYAFSLSRLSEGFEQGKAGSKTEEDFMVWKKTFPGRIESAPAVHYHYYAAYLGCHDGRLYKISVINGEIEWSFTSGSEEIRASPAISPDGASVLFSTPYCIFSLDANSGTIRWRRQSNNYILQTSPVLANKNSVFFTTAKGVCAWSLRNGQTTWESNHRNIRTSPLLVPISDASNLILFGDSTGCIYALSDLDGTETWKYDSNHQIPNTPVYHSCTVNPSGNTIAFTTHEGSLLTLDPLTGQEKFRSSLVFTSRSKPVILDVFQSPRGSESSCYCCYFSTSLDGQLYILPFKPSSTSKNNDKEKEVALFTKVLSFSQAGAESFSSPVFSSTFSILAVGARDNCIHFIKIN